MERNQKQLRHDYETKFIHAWKQDWRSDAACDVVMNLNYWQDCQAGPISKIVGSGGCQYVYDREDEYFTGVNDPSDLTKRLREWNQRAIEEIDNFQPKTDDEAADRQDMYATQEKIWEAVESFLDIERARWATRTP